MTKTNKALLIILAIGISAGIAVVALGMAFTSFVEAKTVPVDVVNSGIVLVNRSDDKTVFKYYDYDNGTVCYTYAYRGISCVK